MAVLVAIGSAAMIAIAFLTPQSGSGGMMGRSGSTYDIANMLLAMVGAVLLTGSVAFLLLRESYQPLEIATIPDAPAQAPGHIPPAPPPAEEDHSQAEAPIPPTNDNRHLALRLLSGDERAVFRAIIDAGGETYQKDVVVSTKMSDAKVSRVLDRLEEKGLVVRERHGMSNKVRIEIEA
jgi:uncharacterized membrane protein